MSPLSLRLRSTLATLVLALGVASCSTAEPPTSGADAAGPAATTRSVETAFGPVTIPTAPARAVALEGGVGPLLGAGITPLATADGDYADAFLPAEYAAVKDLPLVLGADGLDFEKIASLEPDLMIGFVRGGKDGQLSADARTEWEKLQAIAPTVLIQATGSSQTKDATLQMSTALGDGADAEAAKAAYDAKAAQLRTDYADVLGAHTFAAVDFYEEVYVYSPISWPGDTIVDAGGRLTEVSAREETENATFLSAEQLGRIDDADVVLFEQTVDGKPGEGAAALAELPTYEALDAVEDGHAYGLGYFFADRYETGLKSLESLEQTLQKLRTAQ